MSPFGFEQVGFATFTANVAVTTTSEISVVASGPVSVPRQTCQVCVLAWAQLTTGGSTTAVTPRIRRGSTTGGALVGEANAENVKAAAGSTEPMFLMAIEERADLASVDYNFTLQQTGAAADGTALQGGILVFVR